MSKHSTVIIAIVGLAALAAGTLWSDQIRSFMGLRKSASKNAVTSEPQPGQLWTCGMHPQVIQDKPGDCPICHMKLTPLKVDAAQRPPRADMSMHAVSQSEPPPVSQPTAASGDRRIKYWWDPMLGPSSISDKPGKSAMGMDLVPVYEDEASPETGGASGGSMVVIDPTVVQNMGVRLATVSEGPLRRSIRAVGYLDEAQPNLRDINLRISGWIRHLYANTEGMHLEKGDPLFDLYSPELRVAIDELITARRSLNDLESATDDMSRRTAHTLYDAAAQKLELWDLPRAQIEALAKLDRAPEVITFVSPMTGHVTEKPVVEGAAVKAGDRVLRIVDHSTLWIDSQVFEKDLPFIRLGQKVEATIASRPGERIGGEVIFVHPHVDMMSRTALVRLAIPNPDLTLRPGMYATVRLEAELAERAVTVPREAIIDTGERQMTFVAQSAGHFEPRIVQMGLAADNGMVQVMDGLAPGESVVVSGQFLLDSESRLREAIMKFLDEKRQTASLGSSTATPLTSSSHVAEGAVSTQSTSMSAAIQDAPDVVSKSDAIVIAYLRLSETLGAPQTSDVPVDPASLIMAAHQLHAALAGKPSEPLAIDVAKSAEALKGETLDRQREVFKALSDALIALVDRHPPSSAIGDWLYVMHCPMAPGHWMQTIDRVNNPFYADAMKQCGEVVRTITTVPRREGNR